ncbi:MAG: lamin tail domain-containing protein [Clostridia bacterium]
MKLLSKILLVVLLVGVLVTTIILLGNLGGGKVTNAGSVVLNEVMTSNKGSVIDPHGGFPDWLELYNDSDKDADISGFGLGDSLTEGAKYVFPAGTVIKSKDYIVIYCSGDADATGVFAPFKLSSAKDDLIFTNVSGKVLDSINLKAVTSGATLGRDPNALESWIEFKEPSPGYPNTEDGAKAYRESVSKGTDIGLYINEFMASNSTTLLDVNGEYSDWIELFNTTDKEIDISGFGISDNIQQPLKYQFPSGTIIKAKSYLVIHCSGQEGLIDSEIHVPFSLRAYEEDVVLSTKKGQVLSSFSYTKQESDRSMARTPDGTGEFKISSTPTPGYPNTEEGYKAFTEAHPTQTSAVFLSEIIGLNNSYYPTDSGEFFDWVELYNSSDAAVNLAGYALSNNGGNPAKWVFPDVSIAPKSYMVVLASGRDVKDTQKKNLETNFRISGSGESVYLFNPDGICEDKLLAKGFTGDMSYGRALNGTLLWYKTPTPGGKNAEGKSGFTTEPEFVTKPGIFDNPITVQLSAASGETIHYTIDSSTPTEASPIYTQPITIEKNTVIRAISVKDDAYAGFVNSGTFLFKTDGVNHALPVVTLVTDNKNLWDPETGIYTYGSKWDPDTDEWPYWETPANFFQDWERPASFEVFSDTGEQVFQQNVGICISGSFGQGREQKGLGIIARDEYGENRLDYPFFEDLPYTSYKALVLRCGAQDQTLSKIRDELSVGLLKGSDVNFLYQDYKPYVLYLNGKYWGVYFMREKRNRFFVAQHEGTDNVTDMNLIKSATRVNYGTAGNWAELQTFVKTKDLTNPDNFKYLDARVDLDSFMDYMICEIYVANSDYWNIQHYQLDNGKWKFIFYDFCWGFHNVNHTTLTERLKAKQPCSEFLSALLKVPEWKDKFCRRFAEILKTVYEPDRVLALINELYDQVEPEIKRERSIFNSLDSPYFDYVDPLNVSSYNTFQTYIKREKTFATDRPAIIKAELQSVLNLSDTYMKEVFG